MDESSVDGGTVGDGTSIPARDLRAWIDAAVEGLAGAREAIDALNVFPVPDSDTGTNLWLTLAHGARTVRAVDRSAGAGEVLAALARGTLLGARGNSGAILTEYLRGLSLGCPVGEDVVTPALLVGALAAAASSALAAVADPAPGTILSAAAAAAAAARAELPADPDAASLHRILQAAADAAADSAERSTGELDVLARAGVVDAGAVGLALVLEELRRVVARGASEVPGTMAGVDLTAPPGEPQAPAATPAGYHGPAPWTVASGEIEVMFVLDSPGAPERTAGDLRDVLAALGDSVVVTGGDGVWQAHVHTDRAAEVLDGAVELARTVEGVVSQCCVRNLLGRDGDALGVVVVTRCPGIVADLARSGAVVLVPGGGADGADVDLDGIVRAVVDAGSAHVAVLPGGPVESLVDGVRGVVGVAPHVRVHVLDAPTDLHAVAGLTALHLAPSGDAQHALTVLRSALATLRTAAPGAGVDDVAALLVPGTEVLTVLHGGRADASMLDDLRRRVCEIAPAVEVVTLASGRDDAEIALGAE